MAYLLFALPVRWLVARDAFSLAEASTTKALNDALSKRLDDVQGVLGPPSEIDVGGVQGQLTDWFDIFRICQPYEIWQCHGEWVTQNNPTFGPGIKERFAMAAGISGEV